MEELITHNTTTPNNITVFSIGVHLQAIEIEINGKKQWRWVVINFEDDTYYNGNIIEICEYANSFTDLFCK